MFVGSGTLFTGRRVQLAQWVAHHRVPASYAGREYVEANEPPASIVIIEFFAAIGRPTPGLTPGLAGLTPSLAGRNRVGGTMSASATHWRAAHVNWFTRRGWCKRYSTDMREHVLLFCLLGLVLIAAIMLLIAPEEVTWALSLIDQMT